MCPTLRRCCTTRPNSHPYTVQPIRCVGCVWCVGCVGCVWCVRTVLLIWLLLGITSIENNHSFFVLLIRNLLVCFFIVEGSTRNCFLLLLCKLCCELHHFLQISNDEFFADTVRDIVLYVSRDLRDKVIM